MTLQVTVRESLDDADGLIQEWRQLHESSGTRIPFSAPEWAWTWLEHFATSDDTPVVFEVREDGRLVGVAPYYRHRMPAGMSRLQPVGTGLEWIGPFELPSMLALPDRGREIARAVVEAVCRQQPQWDWTNVSLGDAAYWLEPEWLPGPAFTSLTKRVVGAVVVDLEVSSPEDVLRGRRNLKESLRRARNRLTSAFGADGWSVRRAGSPEEVEPAFQRLVRLHEERSLADGHREQHRNVFASPAASAFVTTAVSRLATRDRVSVYELVAGGTVIAAQLVLHTATASYSSVSGTSEAGWPYSAVTYLQWQAVRDAHERGHRELNLSVGPNQAKLRWSSTVRHYLDFVIVGPTPKSRVAYSAAQVVSSVNSYREAVRTRRGPKPSHRLLTSVRRLSPLDGATTHHDGRPDGASSERPLARAR